MTLMDAVGQLRATTDQTHKFWGYFQVVTAAALGFAWSDKRTPDVVMLLAFGYSLFAVLNARLVLSSQEAARFIWQAIQDQLTEEGRRDDEGRLKEGARWLPILRLNKPDNPIAVVSMHVALATAAACALFYKAHLLKAGFLGELGCLFSLRGTGVAILLMQVVVLGIAIRRLLGPQRNALVQLQFTFSEACFRKVIEGWGEKGIERVRSHFAADYALLLCYGGLGALLGWGASGSAWYFAPWLLTAAAVFDALENLLHQWLLRAKPDAVRPPWFVFAGAAAVCKWLLLLLFAAFVFAALAWLALVLWAFDPAMVLRC